MITSILKFLIVMSVLSSSLYAQNSSNTNRAAKPAQESQPAVFPANSSPANSSDTLLKYEQFLREETKLHREYTQQYYTNLLILIGAMGTVLGTVLTWLNWKSKEDIRRQVEQKFQENAGILLDEKFKQLDNLVFSK